MKMLNGPRPRQRLAARLPVDHVVAAGIALLAGGAFFAVPGVQPAWADSAPTVRLEPPAMDGSLQNTPANGESGASTIAKKLQNPIGDLISFPIQSNTNLGYGPHHGTQEIVNVQPVVPFHLNSRWNLITRAILPLVWQPSLQPTQTVPFGTGPITEVDPENGTRGLIGTALFCRDRWSGR